MGKVKDNPQRYFEGILQLRNPKDDVVDFVYRYVKKYSKRGVYIAKEQSMGSGTDYYISSKKFLRTLANRLHDEFGGFVLLNERLFSRDRMKSRDIFRLNVLFVVPNFAKGDIIELDNKLVCVKNISKKVTGADINTGSKVSFNCPDKVLVLPVYKTTVSKTKPFAEVLHPETYESVKVDNKKLRQLNVGDEVKVVVKDGVYVV